MKERTFLAPDNMLVGDRTKGETNFLVNNAREVNEKYINTMLREIELKKRGLLGAEFNEKIGNIRREYADMRDAVANAPDTKTALAIAGKNGMSLQGFEAWRRGISKEAATKERILEYLRQDEDGAVKDAVDTRDMVRGTHLTKQNASNFARVTRGLQAFNYIRLLGGAVLGSLTEMYRPAMVHGFGNYMRDGITPLVTNLSAAKLSMKEAKLAGLITERATMHRMMALAEVGDPYARGTALERLMQNASRFATKWNGLALWTDTGQAISSMVSQARILDGAIEKSNPRLLAFLGINENMSERIAKQFVTFGQDLDGVKVANTERWTDPDAVRAYRFAVAKDVDSIIVRPGVGDIPKWAHHPMGKMITQFRSFNMAAHQRVMLRGMQESPARFVSGMVAMTSLGVMSAALRAMRSGDDNWEKWKASASNPGFVIGEGLDMSGLFPLAFEASNTMEKLSQAGQMGSINPIKSPMMAAFPGTSQQGGSARFASRDPFSAVFGPTIGLLPQALQAAGAPINAVTGQDPTKAQERAIQGFIPYNSYIGMKEMLQMLHGDSAFTN
jgi:hypothetical protein